jgi:hypothetical protein
MYYRILIRERIAYSVRYLRPRERVMVEEESSAVAEVDTV